MKKILFSSFSNLKIILYLFILLSNQNLLSQKFKPGKNIEYKMNSKVFHTNRKISVYLPVNFNKEKTYLTAYLFDGQFTPYTDMSSSIMEYYSQSGESVELIIDSIHTENRWQEFVPKSETFNPNSELVLLRDHLTSEVIPFINEKFKTEKFKIGIGHSLGGSFLLYDLFEENSIFDLVVSVSPNMTFDNDYLVTKGISYISTKPSIVKTAYITVGNVWDMENMFRKSIEKFNSTLQNSTNEILNWKFELLDDENHMTTFPRTYNDFLLDFSRNWNITDEKLKNLPLESETLNLELTKIFKEQDLFRKKSSIIDAERYKVIAKRLFEMEEYFKSSIVYNLAILTVSEKESKEKEKLIASSNYAQFKHYCKLAKEAYKLKNYNLSSELYDKALSLDVKNGTHRERMDAVRVYALMNQSEKAFIQLELITNYFKLQSNSHFINDPEFNSLHSDSRWDEYMKKLEQNGK